jgi:hypothetical protein
VSNARRYSPRKRTKKKEQTDKITTREFEEGPAKDGRSLVQLGLLFCKQRLSLWGIMKNFLLFLVKTISAIAAVLIILVSIVVLFVVIGSHKAEESAGVSTSGSNSVSTEIPKKRINWSYLEFDDKMGGKVKLAYTQSLNQVDFGFPYAGSQNAELSLRIHPRYGKDVILKMQKGQFLCHINDCRVTVRFDNGKIKAYSANGPEDHSSETIFIDNYKGFVANLTKAKKLYIEATFFQEGARVFEFDVAGLKW